MDEDYRPLPAPRKGDSLFRIDREGRPTNALVNLVGSADYSYSEGYRIAARSLAKQVCETCTDQDVLVFPIIYLYRHHMELTLKRLIVVGSFLIDRELTKGDIKRLNRHNLDELWSALRPILRSVYETEGWDPIPSEDEEGIEAYLHQLTEIDPDSQATRYPISTNGQKSLRGVTHINIGVFTDAMERLAACLNRIDTELSALRQSKNEFLGEYSTGP